MKFRIYKMPRGRYRLEKYWEREDRIGGGLFTASKVYKRSGWTVVSATDDRPMRATINGYPPPREYDFYSTIEAAEKAAQILATEIEFVKEFKL